MTANYHFFYICSKWVMMNMDNRKLERVTPEIAEEYLIYCPKKLR